MAKTWRILINQELLDHHGEAIRDSQTQANPGGVKVSLGDVLERAILQPVQGMERAAKLVRFDMARTIAKAANKGANEMGQDPNAVLEWSQADVECAENAVNAMYGPIVVGAVYEALRVQPAELIKAAPAAIEE